MLNDTSITLCGYVGGDVSLRDAGGSVVASFRVGSTPRRYRRGTDTWEDESTQWYTVNAWRHLGEHCARSLRRGDPVLVHGRLRASSWTTKEGVDVTSFEVEALAVGHDLNRGASTFYKRPRDADGGAAAPADATSAEGTQEPAPAA